MINPRFYHVLSFLVLLSTFIIIISSRPEPLSAQTCPTIPAFFPATPPKGCWPSGARVKVVFATAPAANGFNQAQINAMWTAFENWNLSKGTTGNCSNVTFTLSSPHDYIFDVVKESVPGGGQADLGGNFFGDLYRISARMRYNPASIPSDPAFYSPAMTIITAHEIGHSFGEFHCDPSCNCQTVMTYEACSSTLRGPTNCDNARVKQIGQFCIPKCKCSGFECVQDDVYGTYTDINCQDACTEGSGGSCSNVERAFCQANGGWWVSTNCECLYDTPVIVDIEGNGFDLTNPNDGVMFDLTATGNPHRYSWTGTNSDDAFLALYEKHTKKLI